MEKEPEKKFVETEEDLTDEDLDVKEEEESGEGKSDQPTENKDNPVKKRQTKEENHYFAELRRKNEELSKKNKELEGKINEADFNARAKVVATETLTELGLDSIEDEYDLTLCEEYEKAVKKGSENPILDAQKVYRAKVKAEKQRIAEAEQKKAEEESATVERNKKVEADKVAFKEKYGITTKEALNDEEFMKMYGDFISYGNMTELYGKYLVITKKEKVQEDEEAKKKGVIPSSNTRASKTKTSITDLEGEDFLKAFNERYN